MPRKKSPTLTEAELRLMEILWKRGAATVADVVAALPPDEPLAYSTVLTTLRILEQKGYLRHQVRGRTYRYEPLVGRGEARRGAIQYVLRQFFNNSAELLVLNLLENKTLKKDEIERLKRRITESE